MNPTLGVPARFHHLSRNFLLDFFRAGFSMCGWILSKFLKFDHFFVLVNFSKSRIGRYHAVEGFHSPHQLFEFPAFRVDDPPHRYHERFYTKGCYLQGIFCKTFLSVACIGCKINQAILKRKGTTDVISVSASINKDELVGDIFICPKIAQKSAQKEKHSLKKEIKILTAHAILHLLGLDHEKKKAEWQKFWQKAEKVIK